MKVKVITPRFEAELTIERGYCVSVGHPDLRWAMNKTEGFVRDHAMSKGWAVMAPPLATEVDGEPAGRR